MTKPTPNPAQSDPETLGDYLERVCLQETQADNKIRKKLQAENEGETRTSVSFESDVNKS